MSEKELVRGRVEAMRQGATYDAAVGSDASSVLRNTYMLLGLTLAFSALIAYLSMSMGWPHRA